MGSNVRNSPVEREKVDEETRKLAALFGEALNLPRISGITVPVECPLCGTEAAMTPARVQVIRQHVEDTKDFKTAESAAKSALAQLFASAEALATAVAATLPWYLKTAGAKRRETGFAVTRIRNLLGDHADEFVGPWLIKTRHLVRAGLVAARAVSPARRRLPASRKSFDQV